MRSRARAPDVGVRCCPLAAKHFDSSRSWLPRAATLCVFGCLRMFEDGDGAGGREMPGRSGSINTGLPESNISARMFTHMHVHIEAHMNNKDILIMYISKVAF